MWGLRLILQEHRPIRQRELSRSFLDLDVIIESDNKSVGNANKQSAFDYTGQKFYSALERRRIRQRSKITIEDVVAVVGHKRQPRHLAKTGCTAKLRQLPG